MVYFLNARCRNRGRVSWGKRMMIRDKVLVCEGDFSGPEWGMRWWLVMGYKSYEFCLIRCKFLRVAKNEIH